jgi:protein TonB
MFETTQENSKRGREAGRRLAVLPAALAVHALALGVVAVGQLWAVERVPEPATAIAFFTLPPPPPPLGSSGRPETRPHRPAPSRPRPQEGQPVAVPDAVPRPAEPAGPSGEGSEVPGGDPLGGGGDVPGGVLVRGVTPEPPLQPDTVLPVDRVSRAPVALYRPVPEYPELARRARVEGVVVLEAVIDRLGNVVDVEIVRDLRLGCGEAAREAVRSWRYEPAMLNGRPVSVRMTVTVRFELRGAS